MKTGICLFWIAVGAIFTFAVTANTSVFNLHIFGVVVMIVGIIGLVTPRRGYEWLGRRVTVKRTRRGAGPALVEERSYPPYVLHNPGSGNAQAGIPDRPSLEPDPEVGRLQSPESEADVGEATTHARTPAEEMASERANNYDAEPYDEPLPDPSAGPPRRIAPGDTEVIEDVYEEPPA
jgi:hypothetical protein